MKVLATFIFAAVMACVESFTSTTNRKMPMQRINMNEASISSLSNDLFEKINSALQLKPTDFTDSYDMNEFNTKDFDGVQWSGTSTWYDEVKGTKMTGVSSYSFGNGGETFASINGWMGPGVSVPHLSLTIGSVNGRYTLETDYIPRGPMPLGSDDNYLNLFYKHELNNPVYRQQFPQLSPKASFHQRLIQSPAYLSVIDLSENDVTDLATTHVTRWLNWISTTAPLEARQKAGYNSRDDKLRQFAFQANLFEYTQLFGTDMGKKMAIAFTGPLAEAYVGGGS